MKLSIYMVVWCRLERVKIREIHSVAKVVGTVITVSGAMVMTLYKGAILTKGSSHQDTSSSSTTESSGQNWVLGTIMLIASCGGWASFFIVQVRY